ncbi:MAG: hypothetical protein JOZ49_10795, partial [Mycolicibacterium sp.]|nr:hypothetical protein [Mycolicibacterium sp.]
GGDLPPQRRRAGRQAGVRWLIAWLAWLVLHLVYLVGFKNRFTTVIAWVIAFLGRGRDQMAITSQMIYARVAMDKLQTREVDALTAAEQAEREASATDGAQATSPTHQAAG